MSSLRDPRVTVDAPGLSTERATLRQPTDEPAAVVLTAVSLRRPRLEGPGLATVAPPSVVVSAVDHRGVPVTGLERAAFAVQRIAPDHRRHVRAYDVTIDTFGEVAPGVYALGVQESRDAMTPYALVVSVTSPLASSQGRVLVRVDTH